MGTLSQYKKLYIVASDELVDVESQLNYNWRILDENAKLLFQALTTDVTSISTSTLTKQPGYRWYKTASNAVYYGTGVLGQNPSLRQDPGSYVDGWNLFTTYGVDWEASPHTQSGVETRLCYRNVPDTDTSGGRKIEWRGNIRRVALAEIPVKQNITIGTLPAELVPATSRYFIGHMGLASAGNFKIARIFFADTGSIQINAMGDPTQAADERYISFNGIEYTTKEL